MTIQALNPDTDVETFTLTTNPSRTFISSSTSGISEGLLYVFARRSSVEKEVYPLEMYSSSMAHDTDLDTIVRKASDAVLKTGHNTADVTEYMSAVTAQSVSPRKQQTLEIQRYEPTYTLTQQSLIKKLLTDHLPSYYRHTYPTAHFGYTNYHCLNFFSASSVPSESVLLYPQQTYIGPNGNISGSYIYDGAFSFNFWINPKYTSDVNSDFRAGTLLHLSSCYAVSLISGSSKDGNGCPDKYRILLQLSSSTNTAPSAINVSSLPQFAFVSSDNILSKNTWNHVTIRWGTSTYNKGSGSFVINNVIDNTFVVPSASVTPRPFTLTGNPDVLCVGNYYEGTNTGPSAQTLFFTNATSVREGLLELVPGVDFAPAFSYFRHPLNAEVHDIKIYNKYLSTDEIEALYTDAPATTDNNLMFYVPPFFTYESPLRTFHLGSGGVMTTPFQTMNNTTTAPFLTYMSFAVGGFYINLENYTREFIAEQYPRLWCLTGSASPTPVIIPQTANMILYATGSNRRRAATILPCDNGHFYPNYSFLSSLNTTRFVNDLYQQELGSISLRDLYNTSSVYMGLEDNTAGSILSYLYGPDPSDSTSLGDITGSIPCILQRTRDNTSNQISMYDISNLYYGLNIEQKSLYMVDSALSGTDGKVHITLKDDGEGNIYRADATGSNATWNSVGTIFYNEGAIILKSPHLYFFGTDQYSLSFNGVQNTHILRFNVYAQSAQETSSSNPSYLAVSASDSPSDTDKSFTYIDQIYFLDDNLNCIMKAVLAQPLMKRASEKFKFTVRCDF